MNAKKVVIAVSFEAETWPAFEKIKDFELETTSEIHLVHVIPTILYSRGMQLTALTYPLPEERPKIEEFTVKKLQKLGEDFFKGKNLIFKCFFGSNEKAMFCDYANDINADLVVVATRAKHGVRNLFDSSFAQHQLRHCACNVLILK